VPAPEVSGTTVKVQAENYKVGGEGTGYHDLPLDGITQEGNAGGAYRTGDSVDIKEISGGHAVGWMKTGEWLKYDLPISQAGRYRMIIRGAALEAGRDLRIEVNGQWVGEVQAPPTGDYANLTETYLTGIDLPQGNIEVRIEVLQEYMDLDYFMFVKDDREKACRGDYNRDGIVNLSDFQTFAVNYKQPNIQCSLNIDLDGCTLDLADFQSFALVYKDESACSN
jgi:hypothetical protein